MSEARSREVRLAYQRGYQTGLSGRWPDHKPPAPPCGIVRQLMEALKAIRDEADSLCSMLDEKDEFVLRLSPRINAADEALKAVTDWLLKDDLRIAAEPRS